MCPPLNEYYEPVIHSNNIFSHTRGTLANKTSEAQATGADTVIMTEGPAVLARHQGLDVAAHGARDPVLGEGRGLGQKRHSRGLEHHLVSLVVGSLGGGCGLHSDNLALGDVLGLRGGGHLTCAGLSAWAGGLKKLLTLITEGTLLS